jgi:hypothetical protein
MCVWWFIFLQVVHTDNKQDCSDDSIHGTYSDNDIDVDPKDPDDNVYSGNFCLGNTIPFFSLLVCDSTLLQLWDVAAATRIRTNTALISNFLAII